MKNHDLQIQKAFFFQSQLLYPKEKPLVLCVRVSVCPSVCPSVCLSVCVYVFCIIIHILTVCVYNFKLYKYKTKLVQLIN